METPPQAKGSLRRGRRLKAVVWQHKGLLIGIVISGAYLVVALVEFVASLLGVSLTPYNALTTFVGQPFASPSWAHLLGTDEVGRDLFSRILAATPIDVGTALSVVAVALVVGLLIGSYAGYKRGVVDEILMRFTDVFFALPALVLAIVISIIFGPGIINMTYVLMLIWWPGYARFTRGLAMEVSHENYIVAARMAGSGTGRIVFKHVMPNIIFLVLVFAAADVGGVILVFSGLSYLGLAVSPPQPDWGNMVNAYQDYLISAPWLAIFPGIAIAFSVIGFTLLGEGLQEAFGLERR